MATETAREFVERIERDDLRGVPVTGAYFERLLALARLGALVEDGDEATVEALARALCVSDGGNPDEDIIMDVTYPPKKWKLYVSEARAVLARLKEIAARLDERSPT